MIATDSKVPPISPQEELPSRAQRSSRPFFFVLYSGDACCHYDTELLALLINDSGKALVEFVTAPKHADVLYVAGFINAKRAKIIRTLYDQMPAHKAVIAAGSCALSKGMHAHSYVTSHVAEEVVPVDVFVAGCPPPWQAIAEALARLAERP